MNSQEKVALKHATARIRELANLEKASFGMSAEYDKTIKDGVRAYMVWFECVADFVDALANAEDKYATQNAIDDILRYCN